MIDRVTFCRLWRMTKRLIGAHDWTFGLGGHGVWSIIRSCVASRNNSFGLHAAALKLCNKCLPKLRVRSGWLRKQRIFSSRSLHSSSQLPTSILVLQKHSPIQSAANSAIGISIYASFSLLWFADVARSFIAYVQGFLGHRTRCCGQFPAQWATMFGVSVVLLQSMCSLAYGIYF